MSNQKESISGSATPAIESLGIAKGHDECNYLDQTIPVLAELLALLVAVTGDQQVNLIPMKAGIEANLTLLEDPS